MGRAASEDSGRGWRSRSEDRRSYTESERSGKGSDRSWIITGGGKGRGSYGREQDYDHQTGYDHRKGKGKSAGSRDYEQSSGSRWHRARETPEEAVKLQPDDSGW